jgi:hypothetical protein
MFKKCFFILFFVQLTYSQNIKGVVLDSISKKPIELTNVFFTDTYYGTFTNEKGVFQLNIKDNKSDILITNIGYESKKIKLASFVYNKDSSAIFYLKPKIEELDAVIISNKKSNYSSIKSILSEREKTLYYAFQFGSENVTFIKNEFRKKGKIQTVLLDLKRVSDYKEPCKKCKVEYIVSLNIKFYEYDKRNKIPGKEIYNKNIIVELQNKTYKLKVDVDSLNIKFPEDGVCVGVETVNSKYERINHRFGLTAPSILFTNTKSREEVISWSRYRNEGWKFNTDSNQKSNAIFFKKTAVDLKVKIEK